MADYTRRDDGVPPEEEWIVKDIFNESEIIVDAWHRDVGNAIRHWVDSTEATDRVGWAYILKHELIKAGRMTIIDLYQEGRTAMLFDGETPHEDAGSIIVRNEGGNAHVEANIRLKKSKDLDTVALDEKESRNMTRDLLNFVRNNPHNVSLGYGPQFPLEDIEPVSVNVNTDLRDPDTINDIFRNWIRECITRTHNTNKEHAFYVDTGGNVIGIHEGSFGNVKFRLREEHDLKLIFHTHPSLQSLAYPSQRDVEQLAETEQHGALMGICNANSHIFFREYVDDAMQDKYKNSYPANPFNKFPTLYLRRAEVQGTFDCGPYYDRIDNEMRQWITQQLKIKNEAKQRMEDTGRENIMDNLKQDFGVAKDLGMKVFTEASVKEKMVEICKDDGVRFQFGTSVFEI